MPNAVLFYRLSRWFYLHHLRFCSLIVQLIIFLLYNSRIPGDCVIGKGTCFAYKGISTLIVHDTVIGNNCMLGVRFSTIRIFPYKSTPVIKDNVWIGPNVIVAGPVIVDDNVIIAGGSFVNKSVPEGAIVAGTPARIIGWRKDLSYNIEDNPKFLEGTAPYLSYEGSAE